MVQSHPQRRAEVLGQAEGVLAARVEPVVLIVPGLLDVERRRQSAHRHDRDSGAQRRRNGIDVIELAQLPGDVLDHDAEAGILGQDQAEAEVQAEPVLRVVADPRLFPDRLAEVLPRDTDRGDVEALRQRQREGVVAVVELPVRPIHPRLRGGNVAHAGVDPLQGIAQHRAVPGKSDVVEGPVDVHAGRVHPGDFPPGHPGESRRVPVRCRGVIGDADEGATHAEGTGARPHAQVRREPVARVLRLRDRGGPEHDSRSGDKGHQEQPLLPLRHFPTSLLDPFDSFSQPYDLCFSRPGEGPAGPSPRVRYSRQMTTFRFDSTVRTPSSAVTRMM